MFWIVEPFFPYIGSMNLDLEEETGFSRAMSSGLDFSGLVTHLSGSKISHSLEKTYKNNG